MRIFFLSPALRKRLSRLAGPEPPRLASALLRLLLPEEVREFVQGDLEEEYRETLRERGRPAAARRFWRLALSSIWDAGREGARSKRSWGIPRFPPGHTSISSGGKGPGAPPGPHPPFQGDGLVGSFMTDLRIAARDHRRHPAFSLAVVVTLALCIGANGAVFAALDAVLLRPLPYPGGNELVLLFNSYENDPSNRTSVAAGELADYQDRARVFQGFAGMREKRMNLTGAGDPLRLLAMAVSPEFFQVMGVPAARGRTFSLEDGEAPVVVLSHGLWSRLGRKPVGSNLTLDGTGYQVVGIMPPEFRFPDVPGLYFPGLPELWIPADYRAVRSEGRGSQYLRVVARIFPGTSLADAHADIQRVGGTFREEYPRRYRESLGWAPTITPLREQAVGDVRPAFLAILAGAGLLLLMAGANVAGLVLVRGIRRRRDLAVRVALGATRPRLVRQLLAENLLLAAGAGALSLVVAAWGIRLFRGFDLVNISRLQELTLSPRLLLFTGALTLLSALLFGLAPTLQVTGDPPGGTLHAGLRVVGRGRRGRRFLVAGQVGLAVVVLVGAGLLLRSFMAVLAVDTGFRVEEILTFNLSLPAEAYPAAEERTALVGSLTREMASLPGAMGVGGVYPLPLSGQTWGASYSVEGKETSEGDPSPHGGGNIVTPGYFSAMGIRLLDGRSFDLTDAMGSPWVAIVDEQVAREHWPGESAIGKRIGISGPPGDGWVTVVGVVEAIRREEPRLAGEGQLYFPYAQWPTPNLSLVIHTGLEPSSAIAAARAVLAEEDPLLPLADPRTMASRYSQVTAEGRFTLLLLGTFGIATLLLGALGIYGLMASEVAARTREFGVRLTLGEPPSDLLLQVMGEGLLVAILGLIPGIVLAALATRHLRSLLFGVEPLDLLTFTTIPGLLLGVAVLAALSPALRATRVDPARALRGE